MVLNKVATNATVRKQLCENNKRTSSTSSIFTQSNSSSNSSSGNKVGNVDNTDGRHIMDGVCSNLDCDQPNLDNIPPLPSSFNKIHLLLNIEYHNSRLLVYNCICSGYLNNTTVIDKQTKQSQVNRVDDTNIPAMDDSDDVVGGDGDDEGDVIHALNGIGMNCKVCDAMMLDTHKDFFEEWDLTIKDALRYSRNFCTTIKMVFNKSFKFKYEDVITFTENDLLCHESLHTLCFFNKRRYVSFSSIFKDLQRDMDDKLLANILDTFGSSRFDLNCAQLFIATWLNTNIKPKTLPIIGWIRSVHKQHTM